MTTYSELQKQIAELQYQAEEIRQQEIKSVIREIRENIKLYDLTAEQLGFALATTEKQKVKKDLEAKYRDPETNETWVGRGAQPKWLREHLKAGYKKEDFEIPDQQ